jgi:small subunit ribosomal protein S7
MRTKQASIRDVQPDVKYGSTRVTKLINYVMRDGKKTVAVKQVYAALEQLGEATGKTPIEAFEDVIRAVTPQMEVRSRRVGGAAYQVPMPVRDRRGFALALRWLVIEANKRSNRQYHTFAEKLVAEMLDALQNQGGAIAKKQTSHRMADANKAFAHFRW